MTDIEFDIIDELYFVVHYKDLQDQLSYSDEELKQGLKDLLGKGWVKCFSEPDEEVYDAMPVFDQQYKLLYYLATKEGLKAHNSL